MAGKPAEVGIRAGVGIRAEADNQRVVGGIRQVVVGYKQVEVD